MRKFTLTIFILLFVIISNAQIVFQKTFGGTNGDYGNSVCQTFDGGYVISGYTTNNFGAGNADFYLIRTNVNGDTVWTKTFGGISSDYGTAACQTADSGFIITGISANPGTGIVPSLRLVKTDANGDTLWVKALGGAYADGGISIKQTSDGGYIIGGYTSSFGAGSYDVGLIKTDANGNFLWAKTFGGTNYDYGNSVWQTTDGGYIIAGYTLSFGAGDYDSYLIRTNSSGDTLWTKTYGGSADDRANGVQQTSDGGFIITGYTASYGSGNLDIFLIKIDTNGGLLWSKEYGGTGVDYGTSVMQTTDGGYIISARTNSFGGLKAYVIKTNSNGNFQWEKLFGGVNGDEGNSVQQTADGGYIITGSTWSFGAGDADVYLIKTDANGNSGCNQVVPPSVMIPAPMQVTNAATVSTSPSTIMASPGTIVGSGGITGTPCTSAGINETAWLSSLTILPNPSAGSFIISFDRTIINGNVEVINTVGETIFAENINNISKKEIKLKNISTGIYFVKVFDGEKSFCRKIIITND